MSTVTTTLKLGLSPASGSFPFSFKSLTLDAATKLVLGAELQATDSSRKASNTNGWFAPVVSTDQTREPISPLSLSSSHAEVWSEGGKIYIRDLQSPFGTFVNSKRIKTSTALKSGDIISLGTTIARNAQTPSYITDSHLKPVVAKVEISS